MTKLTCMCLYLRPSLEMFHNAATTKKLEKIENVCKGGQIGILFKKATHSVPFLNCLLKETY